MTSSNPTPAEQIDGLSIRELVCLDDKDKATRLVEKLLIRERLEARLDERRSLSFNRVYGKDYQSSLEHLEEVNLKRIATLEQQLNEETEL